MKTGILSMQRVVNYGSFLQSYALREILVNLGHECFFVDIKPGEKIINDRSNNIKENKFIFLFKRIDRYILKRIKHKFFLKKELADLKTSFFLC